MLSHTSASTAGTSASDNLHTRQLRSRGHTVDAKLQKARNCATLPHESSRTRVNLGTCNRHEKHWVDENGGKGQGHHGLVPICRFPAPQWGKHSRLWTSSEVRKVGAPHI
eukprot:2703878-Amphidinium_carterae.2